MTIKTANCRMCGHPIVWLPTRTGALMPIDAETVKDSHTRYQAKVHRSHFGTCRRTKAISQQRAEEARRRAEVIKAAEAAALDVSESLDRAPQSYAADLNALGCRWRVIEPEQGIGLWFTQEGQAINAVAGRYGPSTREAYEALTA